LFGLGTPLGLSFTAVVDQVPAEVEAAVGIAPPSLSVKCQRRPPTATSGR